MNTERTWVELTYHDADGTCFGGTSPTLEEDHNREPSIDQCLFESVQTRLQFAELFAVAAFTKAQFEIDLFKHRGWRYLHVLGMLQTRWTRLREVWRAQPSTKSPNPAAGSDTNRSTGGVEGCALHEIPQPRRGKRHETVKRKGPIQNYTLENIRLHNLRSLEEVVAVTTQAQQT